MPEMHFPQLTFLEFSDSISGTAELFPSVWQALEGVVSPEVNIRHESLDQLNALNAPQISPLVAYVLATRLIDPDLRFRQRVIETLGEVLTPEEGEQPLKNVRQQLKAHCVVMGRGTILATLEVADMEPSVESHVAAIFRLCSHAGTILTELAADRRVAVPLRKQAIHFLGRVGFVEAVPHLERLVERLASRANGQKRMPFAPPSEPDETSLLTPVQATLSLLLEP